MSQRGSFVTEYIYCPHCAAAVERVLCEEQAKRFVAYRIPSWQPGERLPIIAGKVGGSYPGEEFMTFESEVVPALELVVCHPLSLAVIADDHRGSVKAYRVEPMGRG